VDVGATGAALANAFFLRPDRALISLLEREPEPNVCDRIEHVRRGPRPGAADRLSRRGPGQLSYSADVTAHGAPPRAMT
jgi:hypothetical protein